MDAAIVFLNWYTLLTLRISILATFQHFQVGRFIYFFFKITCTEMCVKSAALWLIHMLVGILFVIVGGGGRQKEKKRDQDSKRIFVPTVEISF